MREMTDDNWYVLSAPPDWNLAERKAFQALAEALAQASGTDGPRVEAASRACATSRPGEPSGSWQRPVRPCQPGMGGQRR